MRVRTEDGQVVDEVKTDFRFRRQGIMSPDFRRLTLVNSGCRYDEALQMEGYEAYAFKNNHSIIVLALSCMVFIPHKSSAVLQHLSAFGLKIYREDRVWDEVTQNHIHKYQQWGDYGFNMLRYGGAGTFLRAQIRLDGYKIQIKTEQKFYLDFAAPTDLIDLNVQIHALIRCRLRLPVQ